MFSNNDPLVLKKPTNVTFKRIASRGQSIYCRKMTFTFIIYFYFVHWQRQWSKMTFTFIIYFYFTHWQRKWSKMTFTFIIYFYFVHWQRQRSKMTFTSIIYLYFVHWQRKWSKTIFLIKKLPCLEWSHRSWKGNGRRRTGRSHCGRPPWQFRSPLRPACCWTHPVSPPISSSVGKGEKSGREIKATYLLFVQRSYTAWISDEICTCCRVSMYSWTVPAAGPRTMACAFSCSVTSMHEDWRRYFPASVSTEGETSVPEIISYKHIKIFFTHQWYQSLLHLLGSFWFLILNFRFIFSIYNFEIHLFIFEFEFKF